jgi:ribosomal-protein-alanine acetyltransferase
MSYRLQRASAEDLPDITRWESVLFASDAWSPELVAAEVSHPASYYLVARVEDGPEIVGYAGLRATRAGGVGDVQTIAVVPDHRGKGLGRRLLRALLDEARYREVVEVFLEVRADNEPAVALYHSEGFEPIDRRVGYYQPDGVDAIVMRVQIPPTGFAWAVDHE